MDQWKNQTLNWEKKLRGSNWRGKEPLNLGDLMIKKGLIKMFCGWSWKWFICYWFLCVSGLKKNQRGRCMYVFVYRCQVYTWVRCCLGHGGYCCKMDTRIFQFYFCQELWIMLFLDYNYKIFNIKFVKYWNHQQIVQLFSIRWWETYLRIRQ